MVRSNKPILLNILTPTLYLMSNHTTWEEDVDAKLQSILNELQTLKDMVGTAMEQPVVQMTQKQRTPSKPAGKPDPKTGLTQICDLRDGDKSSKDHKINISGSLVAAPSQREVDTTKGSKTITEIIINDGTGELPISFWGEQGDPMLELTPGDMVRVDNIWRIKSYKDSLQADPGMYCKVSLSES